MKLKLDMSCHLLNAYTKFQIDISKPVEKKSGKLGRTDGRTDGQTDGHCHSIIRPFFKRAYKKWDEQHLTIIQRTHHSAHFNLVVYIHLEIFKMMILCPAKAKSALWWPLNCGTLQWMVSGHHRFNSVVCAYAYWVSPFCKTILWSGNGWRLWFQTIICTS